MNVNNVLYLNLSGNSGTVNLVRALPIQSLTLKQVFVTWDSTADSTTAGHLINVEIEAFSNLRFNSNRSRNINDIPILNDVSQRVTQYSPDMPVHADRLIQQSFSYNIYNESGTPVLNLTNIDLVFTYNQKAIIN